MSSNVVKRLFHRSLSSFVTEWVKISSFSLVTIWRLGLSKIAVFSIKFLTLMRTKDQFDFEAVCIPEYSNFYSYQHRQSRHDKTFSRTWFLFISNYIIFISHLYLFSNFHNIRQIYRSLFHKKQHRIIKLFRSICEKKDLGAIDLLWLCWLVQSLSCVIKLLSR